MTTNTNKTSEKISQSVNSFLDDQKLCLTDIKKEEIIQITKILLDKRNDEKQFFVCGNGGSASTASHFVSDLVKTAIMKDQKRFKAHSLVDNLPVISAWSNDKSYDDVFLEQLKNFLEEDDVLIVFSGSGNSTNIIKAIKYANSRKAISIGLTGMGGGKMKNLCDVCLTVNSDNMLAIESTHLTLCHCIITSIRSMGKPLFKYE